MERAPDDGRPGPGVLDFYRSLDEAGRGWFSRTRAIAIRELANAERRPVGDGEGSKLQRPI